MKGLITLDKLSTIQQLGIKRYDVEYVRRTLPSGAERIPTSKLGLQHVSSSSDFYLTLARHNR